MRYIWLVALREFAENVKTKGFWIGVLMFPVLLWASIKIPPMLEEDLKPTRYFALVDQTGEFEDVVDSAIKRNEAVRVIKAIGSYAAKHSKNAPKAEGIDLKKLPPDMQQFQQMITDFADANPELIEQFLDKGLDFALEQLKSTGQLRDDAPPFQKPRVEFARITEFPEGVSTDLPPNEVVDALKPYLLDEKTLATPSGNSELFALLVIPKGADKRLKRPDRPLEQLLGDDKKGVQYWSSNLADTDLKNTLRRALNREVQRREYTDEDIEPDVVRRIERTTIAFSSLSPKKAEGEEKVTLEDTIRQFAPLGFVYLLFVALMTVATMLLNNTVEEKSNRIIEVLLSSVTPSELMTGKLLGIAGVGILMLVAWIISIVGVLLGTASPEVEWAVELLKVLQTSGLLWIFVIYFLLGYLLYAGIFLAIGSICSTLKEAQNFMGPVMLVMMVPMLTMVFTLKDPHGTLATVLTWVPIYTPFVMMNRAAADPPLMDVIGSGALLIVSIVVVLWASGKIFKLAILRTGQPPRIVEMLRWIRS